MQYFCCPGPRRSKRFPAVQLWLGWGDVLQSLGLFAIPLVPFGNTYTDFQEKNLHEKLLYIIGVWGDAEN